MKIREVIDISFAESIFDRIKLAELADRIERNHQHICALSNQLTRRNWPPDELRYSWLQGFYHDRQAIIVALGDSGRVTQTYRLVNELIEYLEID